MAGPPKAKNEFRRVAGADTVDRTHCGRLQGCSAPALSAFTVPFHATEQVMSTLLGTSSGSRSLLCLCAGQVGKPGIKVSQ